VDSKGRWKREDRKADTIEETYIKMMNGRWRERMLLV
jgi:hypothetical protein